VALRNIVRSRQCQDHAMFIDFGRAQITTDTVLLDAQVGALEKMLRIGRGVST
jgi:hypothetical protein